MANYYPEFDKEFESDQEIEKELDTFIKGIGLLIKEQEKGTFVTNPECLHRISFVYRTMKRIVKGKKVKISYELNKPFISAGSITIVGKNIQIVNPKLFVEAAGLADTMEVYPKTNSTMQLDFGFDGLAKKASE